MNTYDVAIHYEAREGCYGGHWLYLPEVDCVQVEAETKREAKVKALPLLRQMPYFKHGYHYSGENPFKPMTVYGPYEAEAQR